MDMQLKDIYETSYILVKTNGLLFLMKLKFIQSNTINLIP